MLQFVILIQENDEINKYNMLFWMLILWMWRWDLKIWIKMKAEAKEEAHLKDEENH